MSFGSLVRIQDHKTPPSYTIVDKGSFRARLKTCGCQVMLMTM